MFSVREVIVAEVLCCF